MLPPQIKVIGIPGIPEVRPGDSPGELIASAMRRAAVAVCHGDVLVVAQKIVSKAEGRIVELKSVTPSDLASQWAAEHQRDPRIIEVVLRQAKRIVRMDRGRLIVETEAGFICANAGVDASNAPPECVTLLPVDGDVSSRRIRVVVEREFGVSVGVIVSDTFGRPWRVGLTNVAVGTAGVSPLLDLRGSEDSAGRKLEATVIAMADELASAAELVMGKTRRIPAAIVRGAVCDTSSEASVSVLIRPPEEDLFR